MSESLERSMASLVYRVYRVSNDGSRFGLFDGENVNFPRLFIIGGWEELFELPTIARLRAIIQTSVDKNFTAAVISLTDGLEMFKTNRERGKINFRVKSQYEVRGSNFARIS